MSAIASTLRSIPWDGLSGVLLFVVTLLLVLVSRRLYNATKKYATAIEKMAGNGQSRSAKEETNSTERYMKEMQDLINLERLKFLEQLEFFYKNRPDEIKPRFGLERPQHEQRFLGDLAESRMKLSRKVFEDIVRAAIAGGKR